MNKLTGLGKMLLGDLIEDTAEQPKEEQPKEVIDLSAREQTYIMDRYAERVPFEYVPEYARSE